MHRLAFEELESRCLLATTISISDVTIAEGDTGTVDAIFAVSVDRSTPPPPGPPGPPGTDTSEVTVSFTTSTAGGSAASDVDFISTSGTLTFTNPSTIQTITVKVRGDTLDEADETFSVVLSSPSPSPLYALLDDTGIGTIEDNDPIPGLQIIGATVTEGTANPTDAVFRVLLSAPSEQDLTVGLDVLNGTANNGSDFDSINGSVLFAPGQTEDLITIPVRADAAMEPDETFFVQVRHSDFATVSAGTSPTVFQGDASLSATDDSYNGRAITFTSGTLLNQTAIVTDYVGASRQFTVSPAFGNIPSIGDGFQITASAIATGLILNDDATLSIADVSVLEGNTGTTPLTFTLTLSAAVDVDVSVDVNTTDGSATTTSGDYRSFSNQRVTIAAGQTTAQVTVLVNGDGVPEQNEGFTVQLSQLDASGRNVTFARDSAAGTIINDDAIILFGAASVLEGNSGTAPMRFIAVLTGTLDVDVSLNVTTEDGTATAGIDYNPLSLRLTIRAGTSGDTDTIVLTPSVIGDRVPEANETFRIRFDQLDTGGRNVQLVNEFAVGTIINDDANVSIDDGSILEGDAGDTLLVLTARLTAALDVDVSFDVNTANATDGAGSADYTAIINRRVTIPAGQTTAPVTVMVTGDRLVERDETFFVRLSQLTAPGREVGFDDDSATVTITRDDTAGISIGDESVVEGDDGQKQQALTIQLTTPVDFDVTFEVNTEDATAIEASGDYTAVKNLIVTVPAGQTIVPISVPINGDRLVEAHETFFVQLGQLAAGGRSVQFDKDRAEVRITNDDVATIRFLSEVSRDEGDEGSTTPFVFDVELSNPIDKDITLIVDTRDGPGSTNRQDYEAIVAEPIVLPALRTNFQVTVNVRGDRLVELNETFLVLLGDVLANARSIDVGAGGRGTIENDDQARISVTNVTGLEGNAGPTQFVFTITLSNPVDVGVGLQAATADGTARAVNDYASIDQNLRFAAVDDPRQVADDATTLRVSVPIRVEDLEEVDETFFLRLSQLAGNGRDVVFADGSLDSLTATGTILNDDLPPVPPPIVDPPVDPRGEPTNPSPPMPPFARSSAPAILGSRPNAEITLGGGWFVYVPAPPDAKPDQAQDDGPVDSITKASPKSVEDSAMLLYGADAEQPRLLAIDYGDPPPRTTTLEAQTSATPKVTEVVTNRPIDGTVDASAPPALDGDDPTPQQAGELPTPASLVGGLAPVLFGWLAFRWWRKRSRG